MKKFNLNILVENSSGLNLLIEPFTDTFKAAGLSLLSITNSFSLLLKTIVAGFLPNTERLKNINTTYKDRQNKINERYKALKLMEKAGPDFHVVSFLADPSTYLGAAAFSVIKNTAVELGGSVGIGIGSDVGKSGKGKNSINLSLEALRTRLDKLFGMAADKSVREEVIKSRASQALLVEREQGVKGQDSQDGTDEERAELIKAIAEKTQADFNDWFNNKLEQVKAFNDSYLSDYRLLEMLQKAENIQDLEEFFNFAKEINFDVKEEKIKSMIKTETEKLLNDPSFGERVEKERKDIKGDKEKELKFAGDLVFVASKENLTKTFEEIIGNIREKVVSDILEDMPPKSTITNQNPNTEKIINLLNKIEKEYSITTSKTN